MRVAMIVNEFPVLSQKYILAQAAGLIDAGIDLDIIAAMDSGEQKSHALVESHGLRQRCIVAGVPRSVRSRLTGLPSLFAGTLLRDPVGAFTALRPRYATAARNLKNLYLLRALHGRRYDVIHSQFGPNGLVGAFLKDRGHARALVCSFHGSDITTYPRRHGAAVYRALYASADVVTAGTRFMAARLVGNGCPESRIQILPVGIRAEDYQEPAPGERSHMVLLSVGRLEEVKGYRYALEACARLLPRFPALEYFIAGEGSQRASLQKLAADLGIERSVHFLGSRVDTEIAALYRRASVFLFSGVTAADGAEEGQGLVLQEAQAAGLPVVATRVGGVPEGVRDGETGFLAEQKNAAALAEAVGRLLVDESLRRRMGAAARRFAVSSYDMPILTERLLGIYERAIRSRGE